MKKLTAAVTFPNSLNANPFGRDGVKFYNFITDNEDLVEGDKVVVDTVNGLQIATFEKYVEGPAFGDIFKGKKPKWLIQKVDLEKHNERIAAAERAEILKKEMEERRKKAQELEIYEILAKQDPEMAKLIEEFKTLQGVL